MTLAKKNIVMKTPEGKKQQADALLLTPDEGVISVQHNPKRFKAILEMASAVSSLHLPKCHANLSTNTECSMLQVLIAGKTLNALFLGHIKDR